MSHTVAASSPEKIIIRDAGDLSLVIIDQSPVVVSSEPSAESVVAVSLERVVEESAQMETIVSEENGVSEARVQAIIEETLVFLQYQVNDLDTVSTTTYIGKAKVDGTWLIERIVETGDDLAKDYANESNNATVTTYTAAWTDRLTLTYGEVQTLTGV